MQAQRSRRSARIGDVAVATVLVVAAALGAAVVLAGSGGARILAPGNHGSHASWLVGLGGTTSLAGAPHDILEITLVGALVAWLVVVGLPAPRWWAWGGALLLAVAMAGPPLLSGDVFSYISQGRLFGVHHLNPYVVSPDDVPTDPVLPFVGWRATTSPYGLLFTLVCAAVAPLGVAGALWALKVLALLAAGAIAWLTARIARRRGVSPARATLFVVTNPLFWLYAVGGAHNDLLAMALSLGAITLSLDDRRLAPALAVGSVAIKSTGAIVTAFLIAGSPSRWRAARVTALSTAVVVVLTFLIFGPSGLSGALGLGGAHRVTRLSLPSVALGLTAALRWQPWLELTAAIGTVGLLVATSLRRVDAVAAAGWSTLLVLSCTTLLLPWYAVWLLPLAAVSRSRSLQLATIAFSAYVIVARVTL
jgi:alpha-1,6-mannosyltransferase